MECRTLRKERAGSEEGEVAVGVGLMSDSMQRWLPVDAAAPAHCLSKFEEAREERSALVVRRRRKKAHSGSRIGASLLVEF